MHAQLLAICPTWSALQAHTGGACARNVNKFVQGTAVRRLSRCTSAITGEGSALPRVKPFKFTYEKEIVMYAYFKKLDYFSTECVYAPYAARGIARDLIKDLEQCRPSVIVDLIKSGEEFQVGARCMTLHVPWLLQTPVTGCTGYLPLGSCSLLARMQSCLLKYCPSVQR